MAKPKTVEITTSSGLKLKIDPTVANDMEIIDEFTAIANGTATFPPAELVKKIVGEAGKIAIYEHCRNDTGRVEADKVGKELTDVLNEAAKLLKKTSR